MRLSTSCSLRGNEAWQHPLNDKGRAHVSTAGTESNIGLLVSTTIKMLQVDLDNLENQFSPDTNGDWGRDLPPPPAV